jgi:hypothetical protein
VKGYQPPDTDRWIGTVRIQFNEDNLTFRDVQLTEPAARFATEKKAEKYALKEAEKWVDNRVRQLKIFDRRETRVRLPTGIIWVTVAIAAFCAVIALLAGYLQKARLLERVSHPAQTVATAR